MKILCSKICHRFQTSIGKLSSLGLSDPAATSAPSNNPVLGFHGWDETVPQGSVYLVSIYLFLPVLFFPTIIFSLAQFFFLLGTVFLSPFFFTHPWPQVCFWEAPTYPNPPTTFLPTNPPTTFLPTNPPPTHLLLHSLPSPELPT